MCDHLLHNLRFLLSILSLPNLFLSPPSIYLWLFSTFPLYVSVDLYHLILFFLSPSSFPLIILPVCNS